MLDNTARWEDELDSRILPAIDSADHITITKWDLGRLDHLLSQHATTWSWKAVEFLVRELMRAKIVDDDEIGPSVITMRSRVAYSEDDKDFCQIATLAYPGEREFYDDAISVLSPTGAALIGLSEGQSIVYPAPDGSRRTVSVIKVLSQPEAARRAALVSASSSSRGLDSRMALDS